MYLMKHSFIYKNLCPANTFISKTSAARVLETRCLRWLQQLLCCNAIVTHAGWDSHLYYRCHFPAFCSILSVNKCWYKEPGMRVAKGILRAHNTTLSIFVCALPCILYLAFVCGGNYLTTWLYKSISKWEQSVVMGLPTGLELSLYLTSWDRQEIAMQMWFLSSKWSALDKLFPCASLFLRDAIHLECQGFAQEWKQNILPRWLIS